MDGDGINDILSGCYSRHDSDMAGLFYVLKGLGKGKFKKPEAVKGSDGELLIIPASKKNMVDKICTRPTAADIDGDGDLDLVVGNFGGTFFVFQGEGKKGFNPKPSKLMVGDDPLKVPHHSDPFLIDWDKDGDLDIVSGSSSGGVFLSTNQGNKKEPKFGKMVAIVPAPKRASQSRQFGDDHIKGPQGSTRVFVDDVNGDGKWDLIVGDCHTISEVAEGVKKDEVPKLLKELRDQRSSLMKEMSSARAELTKLRKDKEADKDELKKAQEKNAEVMKRYTESFRAEEKIVKTTRRGTVWVYHQK